MSEFNVGPKYASVVNIDTTMGGVRLRVQGDVVCVEEDEDGLTANVSTPDYPGASLALSFRLAEAAAACFHAAMHNYASQREGRKASGEDTEMVPFVFAGAMAFSVPKDEIIRALNSIQSILDNATKANSAEEAERMATNIGVSARAMKVSSEGTN